ncbi:MAG: hypothetical protein NTV86_04425, partial [Planctomycetota bacterium]|nr:hypothetical protein [Planctomycetota bacterium]
MTKSTFCWVVAGLTVVCLPSWAMAGAEADYKALFGEDEEKVSASNDSKEAAEFATRLVHAARAVGDQKDLQILLCTKAYEFAMKDPSGYQTAIEAMKLEMEVVPDKKGQAQEKLLEALLRRFALSTGAERKRLAEEIVDQLVARGDERASAKRPREAIDLYRKALDVAADSVSGRTGAIMDRIKAASTGLEAEGRLAALKKALKEDPKSTTARTALILAYLGEFDRPVEAVTLLTDDLDETLRTYVPLSAKPVADLGESACLELASWYAGIAGQASSPGKRVLLSKTKACCQRYLGLHATKDAARLKATMLLEKVTKEEEVAGAQHSKVVTVDLANGVRKGGVGNTSDEPRWAIRDSSDGAVQAAIEKAAAFLWTLQQPDGSWHLWKAAGMEDGFKDYIDGPTALVAYALMESGVTPSDKRMERALAWLEKVNARNANGTYVTKGYIPKTYCMGLRCQAWSAAIRQKGDYRRALQKDARQLMLSTSDGSYGYDSTGRPAAGDHSNSQYGTLGVAEAAMAGVDIPAAYWRKVTGHWEASQCPVTLRQ